MNKENLTISIEDYIVDTANEYAEAIEYRIEHDALDNVESRLNQHGWFKVHETKFPALPDGTCYCYKCGTNLPWVPSFCPDCGAKRVE